MMPLYYDTLEVFQVSLREPRIYMIHCTLQIATITVTHSYCYSMVIVASSSNETEWDRKTGHYDH